MILERQIDAAWYATVDEAGQVIVDETAAAARVADASMRVAEVGFDRIEPGSFVTLEFGGDRVHAVNFQEGCVVVLPSKGSNALTLKAALRRWPGERMLDLGRAESSRRNGEELSAGLDETTQAEGYETLQFDSFAEETVNGPQSYSSSEVDAQTRVMACTWIQVVEHFGRISEVIEAEFDIEDAAEIYASMSTPLGKQLSSEGGDFQTSSASQRVGSADAEAVDAVYQAWLSRIEKMVGRPIAEELPSLEARPWRGLLSKRDGAWEPLSFSV